MKKDPMPLGFAIFMFVAGVLIGSVFTFGMQFWNAEIEREDCKKVEVLYVGYEKRYGHTRRTRHHLKEIAIDCSNGERYYIDGVSSNSELTDAISVMSANEPITLLIHPNSNTIVEFTNNRGTILKFDVTIHKLRGEATGFLILGLFLYFCALLGLYYIGVHTVHFIKTKKAGN